MATFTHQWMSSFLSPYPLPLATGHPIALGVGIAVLILFILLILSQLHDILRYIRISTM